MKTTLLTTLVAASLMLSGLALAQSPKAPKAAKATNPTKVTAPAAQPTKFTPPPGPVGPPPQAPIQLAGMKIQSPAFREGDVLPLESGCKGRNISPNIEILDVPKTAKSVALILNDPDAPKGTFTHWMVYDLPLTNLRLDEALPRDNTLIAGGKQGRNDFKSIGYDGPCPPEGFHRYEFAAYALDKMLDLPPGATRAQLEQAMKGHVLSRASLMGRYSRD